LELIWTELKSHAELNRRRDAELRELIDECVRRAMENHLAQGTKLLTRTRSMEEKRLGGLLLDWLRMERTREEFEVVSMETQRRVMVGALELDIKADRVDRYTRNRGLAILDYKTGATSKQAQWNSERPEAPQLPLYAITAEEAVVSVMFAQLAKGDMKLDGISDCGEAQLKRPPFASMAQQVEEWRRVLERVANAFVNGEAAVDPTKSACKLCELHGFCRVSVLGSGEAADE
jgi:RecB family exonuclease